MELFHTAVSDGTKVSIITLSSSNPEIAAERAIDVWYILYNSDITSVKIFEYGKNDPVHNTVRPEEKGVSTIISNRKELLSKTLKIEKDDRSHFTLLDILNEQHYLIENI